MAAAIDDLTEKEKEALRLLLAGHDAKSSANELDISVHTVNDRLRNARRKMGVSSSREAARILGDVEGVIPQSLAPASFGMEPRSFRPDPADLNEMRRTGVSRMVWLAGGMLIMSLIVVIAAIAMMADTPAQTETVAGPDYTSDAPAMEAASMTAAEAFIALIDAGKWDESWEAAGSFFQAQTTAEDWIAAVEPVRAPLGEVMSREVATVQRTSTLPGMPEGEYEVLQFATVYGGLNQPAIETVVMMDSPEGWQVVGYFIR